MFLCALLAFFTLIFPSDCARCEKRADVENLPSYVMDYAPVVHLHTADAYRPAGIEQHLEHIQPEVDHVSISEAPSPLTLENLSSLNDSGGEYVYLTSADNVEDYPDWLFGVEPNSSGKTEGAVSCVVIVNDKGNGLVDAFYMYFYSFDIAKTLKNARLFIE